MTALRSIADLTRQLDATARDRDRFAASLRDANTQVARLEAQLRCVERVEAEDDALLDDLLDEILDDDWEEWF